MVGDFHSFQGQPEEIETLKFAKRSSVSHLAMTHRRGWVGHVLGELNASLLFCGLFIFNSNLVSDYLLKISGHITLFFFCAIFFGHFLASASLISRYVFLY